MSDHVTDAATDAPLPRYELVGGGTPTPEQLAALVVALTPVPVADEAPAARSASTTPRWLRAALLEGVGDRRFASPGDLVVHATEPS